MVKWNLPDFLRVLVEFLWIFQDFGTYFSTMASQFNIQMNQKFENFTFLPIFLEFLSIFLEFPKDSSTF